MIYTIIQGHTKFCDIIIDKYKNIDNIIWSTDTTAPSEDLDKIRKSNIKLITSSPVASGPGNINLQVVSTMAGINHASYLGATHCIKIRSDMLLSDLSKFINYMTFDDRIHHLAYVDHNAESLSLPNERYSIDNWITNYNIPIKNISNYNYTLDFMNYGPIDEMINFWNYPAENDRLPVPAEHKFMYRYLQLKNHEIDMSFENLSKIFGFFLTKLRKSNIQLHTLKWEYDYSTLGTKENKSVGAFLG